MIPGDIPQWIILIWLFTFGAVIGSFLNVCIYRLPQQESLWAQLTGLTNPPSSCPFCKKRILGRDNIPILGWLILRGRCRNCRHSIPARYALIELLNGLLWVVLYVAIVPSGFSARVSDSCLYSPLSPLANPALSHHQLVFLVNAQYFFYLALAEALLVATFIDFDLQIIPDGSTIPALIAGLIASMAIGNLHLWPVWFQSPETLHTLRFVSPSWMHWMLQGPERPAWIAAHPHWHGLITSLAGMAVGSGTILALRIVGKWAYREEVMGQGDAFLMALIGCFLGWQPTLLVFFVAPFCGLIATILSMQFLTRREIPYGPYLSLGAMLVLLFWRPYFSQFSNFFSLGLLLVFQAAIMLFLLAVTLVAVRKVKRWIGFTDHQMIEEWTPGDQLAFYANKNGDCSCCGLKPDPWPGTSTGRGCHHAHQWRHGNR